MEVHLTPDQQAFIRQGIAAGRFQSEVEAVAQAMALWEERERKRAEFLATLEEAKAAIARGEGRVITEKSMKQLAEEVKQRGLARLAAQQRSPR